jgi:hypothetical protein
MCANTETHVCKHRDTRVKTQTHMFAKTEALRRTNTETHVRVGTEAHKRTNTETPGLQTDTHVCKHRDTCV